MKLIFGVVFGFAVMFNVVTASAVPVISVDMDPGTAGIQSTLTIAPGDTFGVDIVLTGDGTSLFDTTIFDVAFNDAGAVLGLSGVPTAGSLASTGFPGSVVDAFTFAPISPGSSLTTIPGPPEPGFASNTGSFGMFSFALFGGPIALGTEIDIAHLSFTATPLVGSSTIGVFGSPSGSPLLAFFGGTVLSTTAAGSVQPPGGGQPVPEPTTFMLLGIGLAGLVVSQRRRFKRKGSVSSKVNKV